MDVNQLIAFLKRIYVWIPVNNPMRQEIKKVVHKLGGRL